MKRIISIILCVICLFSVPFHASAYSARSMVVMEKSSHMVLENINCDSRLAMASTTKIMTALVVIETADLNKIVEIPSIACGVEGTSVYLKEGEKLTVSELLYAMLLESGNDAAVALAVTVGGSMDAFVSMMNDKAKSLGLKNTNFVNPSGLPDDNHYTTAYELALITSAALDNAVFCEIVATKKATVAGRTLINHNKLLSMYEYAVGVKTGFTKKAGRCLVSAAKKNGITLICVTLNASDDWNDHMTAYEKVFQTAKRQCVAKKGEVSVTLPTPDGRHIVASNIEDVYATVFSDSAVIQKLYTEPFLYAPKALGQSVGRVSFVKDGKEIASTSLCLTQPVNDISIPAKKQKKKFFLLRIFNYIKGLFK